MNKFLKYILFTATAFLTVNLIIFPGAGISSAKAAAALCLDTLIPSLFPFFICSGLFVALGASRRCEKLLSPIMRPLFNVPGSGALALTLGLFSGYPVGAKVTADLYRNGECTKAEARRLLAFCNNSGPMFVLGAVGAGFLENQQLGWILYISHVTSAILVGLIFRFYRPKAEIFSKKLPPAALHGTSAGAIGRVMSDSVFTMLNVCGFVVLFSVLAETIPPLGGHLTRPLAHGLLEICGGLGAIARIPALSMYAKLPLIAFVMSLSGLSITLQVWQIISDSHLPVTTYISGKLLQGIFAGTLTWTMFLFVPIEAPAFSQAPELPPIPAVTPEQMFINAGITLFWCAASLGALMGLTWAAEKICKRTG